jgi:hypothetical protein
MSRRRYGAGGLAASLILATALSSGARADNAQDAERRDNLIGLLMVEESARICSFAIADKALQQLVAARAALVQALRLDDPQLAKLRADLDQQFVAERAAYCAPDGPWKKAVDETLAHLPGL